VRPSGRVRHDDKLPAHYAVAPKAARGDKLAVWIDSGYRVVGRDADDLLAPAE
jgi:hypothetical protein